MLPNWIRGWVIGTNSHLEWLCHISVVGLVIRLAGSQKETRQIDRETQYSFAFESTNLCTCYFTVSAAPCTPSLPNYNLNKGSIIYTSGIRHLTKFILHAQSIDDPVMEFVTSVILFYTSISWCLIPCVLLQPAAMFKVLTETPPIPETLSTEGKDFLHCCFQRNPAERPSARMLLEHPFVKS